MDKNSNYNSGSDNQHEKMIEHTTRKLEDSFRDKNVELRQHQNPVKFSEIFHAYMGPFIEEVIDDETLLANTLNFGQLMWNIEVVNKFPEHPLSRRLMAMLPNFKGENGDPELEAIFQIRKKERFGDDDFFIMKHSYLLEDDVKLAISVVAAPVG
ncbi:MAG: hypothetical protein K9H64_07475 [Bacteroidales bacterium]|nr:hypothetical protein [Bacteroidales bacterium]MCF8455619.1 hypothetical protein [Bacteroidales bacterium]